MALFNVRMPRSSYASGKALHEQASIGFSALEANFREFCDALEDKVLPEVMYEALEPTFYLSRVYVPKDTLRLMGSGYIEIKPRRGGAQAEVGYTAPYAVFVHEMVQFRHSPPTSAKYLERAFDEDYYKILGRIVSGVKRRTGM